MSEIVEPAKAFGLTPLSIAEGIPTHSALKQQLFTIVSWVVFLSTLIHGTTVPLAALGSSVHPAFHPRFMVTEERFAGTPGNPDEETPLIDNSGDRDEGKPITRKEIDRILTGDHGDEESLDSRQADALIGHGSGLKGWGRGRVTVFVEGNKLLICDEEGESSDLFTGLCADLTVSFQVMYLYAELNDVVHTVPGCSLKSQHKCFHGMTLTSELPGRRKSRLCKAPVFSRNVGKRVPSGFRVRRKLREGRPKSNGDHAVPVIEDTAIDHRVIRVGARIVSWQSVLLSMLAQLDR